MSDLEQSERKKPKFWDTIRAYLYLGIIELLIEIGEYYEHKRKNN
jgi:hypothetical protein